MDKPFPYFHITTANMIFAECLIIIVMSGLILSYLNYSTQVRDQFLIANNQSITTANENAQQIIREVGNASNATSTLINYLVANFGENSGYIERENFQYQQANETANAVQDILKILNNQSK